mmetsp:Transcript_39736/g.84819  ORF Transcript_39736/g.84819 Transcript_39736/m.84819 type:complete len:298 (+) Transcript_39736:509-1402(+)
MPSILAGVVRGQIQRMIMLKDTPRTRWQGVAFSIRQVLSAFRRASYTLFQWLLVQISYFWSTQLKKLPQLMWGSSRQRPGPEAAMEADAAVKTEAPDLSCGGPNNSSVFSFSARIAVGRPSMFSSPARPAAAAFFLREVSKSSRKKAGQTTRGSSVGPGGGSSGGASDTKSKPSKPSLCRNLQKDVHILSVCSCVGGTLSAFGGGHTFGVPRGEGAMLRKARRMPSRMSKRSFLAFMSCQLETLSVAVVGSAVTNVDKSEACRGGSCPSNWASMRFLFSAEGEPQPVDPGDLLCQRS